MSSLQVVKDSDLEEEYDNRLTTAVLDLTQIIKNQSDAATTTATAASDATSGNMVQAKGHQLKSLSMQTAVSADCAKTLSEMVAIYEEQTNNRIGKLEERQEIQKDFIDPLKGVGNLAHQGDRGAWRTGQGKRRDEVP